MAAFISESCDIEVALSILESQRLAEHGRVIVEGRQSVERRSVTIEVIRTARDFSVDLFPRTADYSSIERYSVFLDPDSYGLLERTGSFENRWNSLGSKVIIQKTRRL